MIFRQFLHTDSVVAASYLFGCGGHGVGAVVDPVEDVDLYLQAADQLALRITHVFDTHVHADHISGGRRLAERADAEYVLHESAEASYRFRPVRDGEEIVLGNVVVRVLHTPGHTPEHICLLVTDHKRGLAPWFALTGHTLMVGDVGRTELASDITVGAAMLYQSLFGKLLRLDDRIEVFPGAFSGSVCGRGLSGKPSSTIGFERLYNSALQTRSEAEFIAFMQQDVPPKPAGFDAIRGYNLGLTVEAPAV